ncbi:MAG TPA: hypothetical protein VN642_05365 [Dongiaceae bacterium]|nr:hypothetical protein [Dongiaceae bacterium]
MLALTLCSTLFAATAYSDESLYVQPFRAKIYSKPSLASEVLGQVDSGFKFVSTGREGNWVKLVVKGKQGFIPAVQTAINPPLGKSAAQGAESAPKLGARARTATTAVVAGMKGLTYEDRARVTKDELSDFEALDKIDALKISPDELKAFQLEGGKR